MCEAKSTGSHPDVKFAACIQSRPRNSGGIGTLLAAAVICPFNWPLQGIGSRVISVLRSSFGTSGPVRTPQQAPPGSPDGQQTVAGGAGTEALNEAERLELSTLVRSNKYNLVVLQNWLGNRMADLEADGELSPQAETLFQALRIRCADRHMHLADLICLHALDEKLDEPVNRGARAAAYLLHADAALNVARDLNAPGLDPTARQRLISDLQAHRDQLTRIASFYERGLPCTTEVPMQSAKSAISA